MKRSRTPLLWAAALVTLWWGCGAAWALDPAKPPGQNFDLNHWKLTLPVNSSGGTSGGATEITAAQLVAGFTNQYFYTGPDGAMVFWCPSDGATTSGSSYPRSELRELLNPNDDTVNWTGNGTHVMDALCTVNKIPQGTKKVIIGQIHGYNVNPLCKLTYYNGQVYALMHTDPNGGGEDRLTFANVPLNQPINYEIKVVDGTLYVTVNGLTLSDSFYASSSAWQSQTFYFKAGSYCQDNTGTNTDGSTVSFYGLAVTHSTSATAPTIVTQPGNQITAVGQTVSFSVFAGGSAPLAYQWYFNTNTALARATNALLTLTNVQATDAGAYMVRVTNSAGSVTSAVALLSVGSPSPPSISSQPVSLAVNSGQSATFTVSAAGTGPLSYQWFFNTNTPLPGATNTALALPSARLDDAGAYSVRVTNSAGAATSAVAWLTVTPPPVLTNSVIVDDQWLDGTRTNTLLPAQAAWYASDATSLVAASGSLTGIASSSSVTWWTYFTTNSASPIQLGPGDTLKVTLKFTPLGVNGTDTSHNLRVGLYDSSASARRTSDGGSPSGTNVAGYMLNLNFAQSIGVTTPLQLMERTDLSNSSLISSSGAYDLLASSSGIKGAPAFSNGVPYALDFSVSRTSNSVAITTAFFDSHGWTNSLTTTDSTITTITDSFDTFVIRPASAASTATNFAFTEFKVEFLSGAPAPATPPSLQATLNGGNFLISWPTNDAAGFQVESAGVLPGGVWAPVSSPSIVGNQYVITNAVAPGTAKFYRLHKTN